MIKDFGTTDRTAMPRHSRNMCSFESSHAFTLIELLVTVGIIGVLASLFLPAFSGAVKNAESAKCIANLKQLSLGCTSYSNDNDGLLIPICAGTASAAKTWRALVIPYLGKATAVNSVFCCPASPVDAGYVLNTTDYSTGLHPVSYGIPTSTGLHSYLNPSFPGKRISAVIHPAATILMGDIGNISNPSAPFQQWTERSGASYGYATVPSDSGFATGNYSLCPRHSGKTKVNVAFYDGHVASVDMTTDLIDAPSDTPNCIYDNK